MGTVTVTVTDSANGTHPVTDTGDSVTGSGGSSGASTTKTETDANGDTTVTDQQWKSDPKVPITKASIKVTRSCPDQTPNVVTVSADGDSVSGRVDGLCVYATSVTTTTDTTGITKTVTKNVHACCKAPGAMMAAAHPLQPVAASDRIEISIDRRSLEGLALARHILG